MPVERIDIHVPDEVLAQNEEKRNRIETARQFQTTDRTPVIVEPTFWSLIQANGLSFAQFIQSPPSYLCGSLLNARWRYENIRDDSPLDTRSITVQPDFGALRGTEFPLDIEWQPDQPAKTRPVITNAQQIDTLSVPDPAGGLNAKKIEFYHGMKEAAADFDVRLNGQPLEIKITLPHAGGPIPSAFALCGTSMFEWMLTEPERMHRLLEITTTSHLNCIRLFDQISGHKTRTVWLGADTAEMVSPALFRKMIAPCYRTIYQHFERPRTLHMCGRIDHLLQIIRDDLGVDYLDGFGFPTGKQQLAQEWGGRVVMRGGPHPVLIHGGPVEAIQTECLEYIHTTGSRGGYLLSIGGGMMPGTPPEHIDAMVAASKRAAALIPNTL